MKRQRGFVAAELALGIGLLLFPVAMLVITMPTWSERQSVARAVAREVARSVVVDGTCNDALAEDIADEMAANLGVHVTNVMLDCWPGRLPRGGRVTAAVTVALPAVAIPGIGASDAWHWTARHTQPVDPYRSFE